MANPPAQPVHCACGYSHAHRSILELFKPKRIILAFLGEFKYLLETTTLFLRVKKSLMNYSKEKTLNSNNCIFRDIWVFVWSHCRIGVPWPYIAGFSSQQCWPTIRWVSPILTFTSGSQALWLWGKHPWQINCTSQTGLNFNSKLVYC